MRFKFNNYFDLIHEIIICSKVNLVIIKGC
jgi:hypothetical protein